MINVVPIRAHRATRGGEATVADEAGQKPRRRLGRWLGIAVGGVIFVFMASPAHWWAKPEPVPEGTTPPTAAAPTPADHAIWLRRRWLHEARTDAEIAELARRAQAHGITMLYPFVGPMKPGGRFGWRDGDTLREVDLGVAASFFARIHAADPALVVLPWTGGLLDRDVSLGDPAWRAAFVAQAVALTAAGADGVQVNIEPMPEATSGYLELLRELRAGMGPGKRVSVAAYPPITPLHPYADVHWSLGFLREVCAAADDVSVMAYDTALPTEAAYRELVTSWTGELARTFAGGPCGWRIGVPSYEDDKPWHRPEAETLRAALDGVTAGIAASPDGKAPLGVAVYASWTTDATEWAAFDAWRGAVSTDGGGVDPPEPVTGAD